MSIKFVATLDTKEGTDGDACYENGLVIQAGLAGIGLVSVGDILPAEVIQFNDYLPKTIGVYYSSVERYVNGAKNVFLRSIMTDKMIGYIIVRPEQETI